MLMPVGKLVKKLVMGVVQVGVGVLSIAVCLGINAEWAGETIAKMVEICMKRHMRGGIMLKIRSSGLLCYCRGEHRVSRRFKEH
jgi:hypothetical protein